MVGAEVESLFSSLETANACYKAILDTEVELENFNYKKGLECRHALHQGRSTGQPTQESPTHQDLQQVCQAGVT